MFVGSVGFLTICKVYLKMSHPHLLYINLINLPSTLFASPAYNLNPIPVHINGVQETNIRLFETLDRFGKEEAPLLFKEHMRAMFGLDEMLPSLPGKKKKYKANYRRLLRGWFFDANRPEGAVMKGWVESRFGIRTQFHKSRIDSINSLEYEDYAMEKFHPRFHNNSIFGQLDCVYEFAQYYLNRFGRKRNRLRLYRGLNRMGDDNWVIKKNSTKQWIIRNNSLTSYTSEIEYASEFGEIIVAVDIPYSKIFCFTELMPGELPSYENEYIVIGGDYISEVIDFF